MLFDLSFSGRPGLLKAASERGKTKNRKTGPPRGGPSPKEAGMDRAAAYIAARTEEMGVRVPNAMVHWALIQPTLQQKPSQHFPLGKLVDQATHFSTTLSLLPLTQIALSENDRSFRATCYVLGLSLSFIKIKTIFIPRVVKRYIA